VQKDAWAKGERIGRGAFGEVFKGMNKLNGEIIAIKELHFEAGQRKQLREMVKEVKLMNRLSHVNIVTYLGGQEDIEGGRLFIFTEYVAGGSVGALLGLYGAFDEVRPSLCMMASHMAR
jgi:mitogen-activated protein kinase kinase kinase